MPVYVEINPPHAFIKDKQFFVIRIFQFDSICIVLIISSTCPTLTNNFLVPSFICSLLDTICMTIAIICMHLDIFSMVFVSSTL